MSQQSSSDDAGLVACATFATSAIAPRDRYEAWRQFLGMTHDVEGTDPAAAGGDFSGRVVSAAMDRIAARIMHADPQTVSRSPQRCRRDGLDHITLHLTTAPFDVETRSNSFHVPRGAITINTLARPFRRSSAPEGGALIISLARDLVTEHIADPEAFHGTVLSGGSGAIFVAHMTALCAQMREVRASEAPALAGATAQLLAAALGSSRDTFEAARPTAQAAILVRCKTYIAYNLHAPDLSPDKVCRGVGVSRAVLYRLFKPTGGAASYIRDERLRAIRDTIVRSSVRPNIAELASSYGFTNIPAFNRSFRTAFGVSPSEMRRLDMDVAREPRVYREWLQTFG